MTPRDLAVSLQASADLYQHGVLPEDQPTHEGLVAARRRAEWLAAREGARRAGRREEQSCE